MVKEGCGYSGGWKASEGDIAAGKDDLPSLKDK